MPRRYIRTILNIFMDSPMDALGQHAKKVIESVDTLSLMLDAYLAGDFEQTRILCDKINDLEFEADKMKQQFQTVLPNSVVIQLDTNDLMSFLKSQDNIANLAQNAAHWMTVRDSTLQDEIKEDFRELMQMTLKCIRGYEKVLADMENLEATSYSSRAIKKTIEKIPEIEKNEYDVDIFEIRVLKNIFDHEEEIGGSCVYHASRMVDNIGGIADKTAGTIDILRRILIKKT